MGRDWLDFLRRLLPPSLSPGYDPFPGYRRRIALDYVRRGNEFAQQQAYDLALEAYNKAIEFQPVPEAFCSRGYVFHQKYEYDRALEDSNRAIAIKPDFAQAFCNRGVAYFEKGDVGQAIQDYEKAISFESDLALAFSNRGLAWLLAGRSDLAIVDCNRAVALNPDLALAFGNRGAAAFCERRFDEAAADFAEAIRLDPNDSSNLSWLYIASARAGQADPVLLHQYAANLNLVEWPGATIGFLLGSRTPDDILAASRDANPLQERKRSCTAHFVIGQQALLEHQLDQAAVSFKRAIESEATTCAEFVAARVELDTLAGLNRSTKT